MPPRLYPITLYDLPYSSDYQTSSEDQWNEVIKWCREHVGKSSVDWAWDGGGSKLLPLQWHFKRQEDLVLFQLRWG